MAGSIMAIKIQVLRDGRWRTPPKGEAGVAPGGGHMIMVSIEVRSASARFRVKVGAEGIEQALSLTRRRYPGDEIRVVFPIEPETFFVRQGILLPEANRPGVSEVVGKASGR
jgi:hypothetical protein